MDVWIKNSEFLVLRWLCYFWKTFRRCCLVIAEYTQYVICKYSISFSVPATSVVIICYVLLQRASAAANYNPTTSSIICYHWFWIQYIYDYIMAINCWNFQVLKSIECNFRSYNTSHEKFVLKNLLHIQLLTQRWWKIVVGNALLILQRWNTALVYCKWFFQTIISV